MVMEEPKAAPQRKRRLVTPLERASVAHLQDAATYLGDDHGVEYVQYEGALDYASYGGDEVKAAKAARRAARRINPCQSHSCWPEIAPFPLYYLVRHRRDILCLDCASQAKLTQQGRWASYEASHELPEFTRAVREVAWRLTHGASTVAEEPEAPAEDTRHSFTVAMAELEAQNAVLVEMKLPTENKSVLKAQIQRYLAGEHTSLMEDDAQRGRR